MSVYLAGACLHVLRVRYLRVMSRELGYCRQLHAADIQGQVYIRQLHACNFPSLVTFGGKCSFLNHLCFASSTQLLTLAVKYR